MKRAAEIAQKYLGKRQCNFGKSLVSEDTNVFLSLIFFLNAIGEEEKRAGGRVGRGEGIVDICPDCDCNWSTVADSTRPIKQETVSHDVYEGLRISFPELGYRRDVLELVGLELPDLGCFKVGRLEVA